MSAAHPPLGSLSHALLSTEQLMEMHASHLSGGGGGGFDGQVSTSVVVHTPEGHVARIDVEYASEHG